jgi:hypothetical protein
MVIPTINKKYGRRSPLMTESFKSAIVEHGLTLVNLLAYVDLNSMRVQRIRPARSRVVVDETQ